MKIYWHEGIFGLLKPLHHVQILNWNVSVCFNGLVISPCSTDYIPQISIFCANPCVLDRHRHYTHQLSTVWLMHFELREAKLLIHFKPNFLNITLFHGLFSMLPPHIEVAVNAVPHIESKPNTLQCSNMKTKITWKNRRVRSACIKLHVFVSQKLILKCHWGLSKAFKPYPW